jgi:addiction module HigA family antidote
MLPTHRLPTAPGEMLLEEFLKPLGLTQTELASRIGAPVQHVNLIVRGKRAITAETALMLSAALGTSPEFWMNLQTNLDLATAQARPDVTARLRMIRGGKSKPATTKARPQRAAARRAMG